MKTLENLVTAILLVVAGVALIFITLATFKLVAISYHDAVQRTHIGAQQ